MDSNGHKTLSNWFDRIYVISRPDRPDRLKLFRDNLVKSGAEHPDKVIPFPAVVGETTSVPQYFKSGDGAWGCLRSHSRIIEEILTEELFNDVKEGNTDGTHLLDSVLILEDDALFMKNCLTVLSAFMVNIPDDWDQLYLGGQHRIPPLKTDNTKVFRGVCINRTHAYALRRKAFEKFYAHINYAPDYFGKNNHHIDHQLELAHMRGDWNIYTPSVWVAGQSEGYSDICNKQLNERRWE